VSTISDINYEDKHIFKGFQGKPDTTQPAVRFKFTIEGCEFPKYSRWLKFTLGEKANLYKKYVSALVKDIKPDDKFDLDHLKGMKVKTLWKQNGDYQNLEIILPEAEPIPYTDKEAEPLPF